MNDGELCLLVLGGTTKDGKITNIARSSLQRCGITDESTKLPVAFPREKSWYASCVVGGYVYVFGYIERSTCHMYKYNTQTYRWRRCASLPHGRIGHSMVAVGTNIYIFGGISLHAPGMMNCFVEKYDTVLNQWETIQEFCLPASHRAAVAYNSDVYFFGGLCTPNVFDMDMENAAMKSVVRFNTETNTFHQEPSLPDKEYNLKAVIYENKVILFGSKVYVYDVETKTVITRGLLSVPNTRFGCCLSNNKVYIAGGSILGRRSDIILSCPVETILSQESCPWDLAGKLPHEMEIGTCVVVEQ